MCPLVYTSVSLVPSVTMLLSVVYTSTVTCAIRHDAACACAVCHYRRSLVPYFTHARGSLLYCTIFHDVCIVAWLDTSFPKLRIVVNIGPQISTIVLLRRVWNVLNLCL